MQFDFQLFSDGSTVGCTTNGGASRVTQVGEAIIHRWHAAMCVYSGFFPARRLPWKKPFRGLCKAFRICDSKALADAVGKPHAPDEGMDKELAD